MKEEGQRGVFRQLPLTFPPQPLTSDGAKSSFLCTTKGHDQSRGSRCMPVQGQRTDPWHGQRIEAPRRNDTGPPLSVAPGTDSTQRGPTPATITEKQRPPRRHKGHEGSRRNTGSIPLCNLVFFVSLWLLSRCLDLESFTGEQDSIASAVQRDGAAKEKTHRHLCALSVSAVSALKPRFLC